MTSDDRVDWGDWTPEQWARVFESMRAELFAARDAASPEVQGEFDRVLRLFNETSPEDEDALAYYYTQLFEIVGLRRPRGPYTKQ